MKNIFCKILAALLAMIMCIAFIPQNNTFAADTMVPCWYCNGVGKITCRGCGGSGISHYNNSWTVYPDRKYQSTAVPCNSCFGTKEEICYLCKGAKELKQSTPTAPATPATTTTPATPAPAQSTHDPKQTEIPTGTTEQIQSFDTYGSTSGNISNGGRFLQIGPARYFYAINGELKQVEDGITTTITGGVSIFPCLNQAGYWIYYQGDEGICKINIDGSNKTVLDGTADARYLIYANGWLYYNDNNANRVIKKMKPDGAEKQVVNNEASYDIFVIGDWIYYRNYDQTTDKRYICKVRTDGTQRTVINPGDCCYLVFEDGYVYYSNFDEGKKLYKMKLDGTSVTKLNDEESNYINVTGSKVVYVDAVGDGVYSINKDGTGRKKEFNIGFTGVYAYENTLYFVDEMSGVVYNSTIK